MKFALAAIVASVILLAGCRQDMHDQPKYKPLAFSDFFADHRSERPPIEGTIARGQLKDDAYFYTGKIGNNPGDVFPMPVTVDVLARGRQRFNIYCAPCHSYLGDGNGMIVQRGYRRPPSFHIDRLRTAPVGHFFDVITNGFGAMPDYSAQVRVADRWAIIAYIRALQLSQNAPPTAVQPGEQIGVAPFQGTIDSSTPGSGATEPAQRDQKTSEGKGTEHR